MKRSSIIRILKSAVFLAATAIIYFKLFHDKDTSRIFSSIALTLQDPLRPLLIVVLLMVVINWLIEARKWQYLVNRFGSISLGRAFKATIAGTCFSLFTPNRVGEFLGRVIFVLPTERKKAVFATIVGSIAQFLTTILMGCFAATWFIYTNAPIQGIQGLGMGVVLSLSLILVFLCLLIYFQPSIIRAVFSNIRWLRKWRQAILVLDRYDNASLFTVLLLSIFRYFVFSTQFVMLLFLFNVDISMSDAYASVFLVYLISTILPTVIFSELGVRELVAWSVMSAFATNEIGIVAASFVLWVINLLLPASVGSLIVLGSRIELSTKQ